MALIETNLATWLDQTIPPAAHTNGTVILLCGISGAGKTTAAQHLECFQPPSDEGEVTFA